MLLPKPFERKIKEQYCNVQEIQSSKMERKFEYQQLEGFKIKIEQPCFQFAFNKDYLLLFAAQQNGKIKVYSLNNGKKLIQIINIHTNYVMCLICMKKTKSLISGGFDKSIKICNLDQNNCWKLNQNLIGHQQRIQCIILNRNENLLISGSTDRTIIFWQKANEIWSLQQTLNVLQEVNCLSLNASQTKLISCGFWSPINVIENQNQQSWVITQKIEVFDQWGERLCFTNDEQFAFQPRNKEYLEIYDYNQDNKKFIKTKQVQVKSSDHCQQSFPSQFIEQNNILAVKHYKYVNIFGINQNGDVILKQSIEFGHECLYGRCSEDGKFLVTWDWKSQEIQMRKLKYLD